MSLKRLDNTSWGFESNCFVCEPKNEHGLRIEFFYDDEADLVNADFTLTAAFSGAPSYVHGGVTLAIMDEAMAWATIASRKSFALTRTTTTTFVRAVKIGAPYRVEARVSGTSDDGELETHAIVLNERGKPCAEADARFVVMSAEQAASAIGSTVEGDDAGYLKG
jgi:acyl-coenzyme A thioesterase PaaI-like protein